MKHLSLGLSKLIKLFKLSLNLRLYYFLIILFQILELNK